MPNNTRETARIGERYVLEHLEVNPTLGRSKVDEQTVIDVHETPYYYDKVCDIVEKYEDGKEIWHEVKTEKAPIQYIVGEEEQDRISHDEFISSIIQALSEGGVGHNNGSGYIFIEKIQNYYCMCEMKEYGRHLCPLYSSCDKSKPCSQFYSVSDGWYRALNKYKNEHQGMETPKRYFWFHFVAPFENEQIMYRNFTLRIEDDELIEVFERYKNEYILKDTGIDNGSREGKVGWVMPIYHIWKPKHGWHRRTEGVNFRRGMEEAIFTFVNDDGTSWTGSLEELKNIGVKFQGISGLEILQRIQLSKSLLISAVETDETTGTNAIMFVDTSRREEMIRTGRWNEQE